MTIGNLFVTTEALTLGTRAGIDLDKLLAVIGKSSEKSGIVSRWDFYSKVKREYYPGHPLDTVYKDMGRLWNWQSNLV